MAAALLADTRDQAKPDAPCATNPVALPCGKPAAVPRGNDDCLPQSRTDGQLA